MLEVRNSYEIYMYYIGKQRADVIRSVLFKSVMLSKLAGFDLIKFQT